MNNAIMSLLLLAAPAAMAQEATCPEVLPEGAIEVKRPPDGWIGISPSLARLTGGGVMRGHPKDMTYLVPHNATKVKGDTRVVWKFEPGEEKWLWCTYGTTAVQVAKRMSDAATTCTLTSVLERRGVIKRLSVSCN